MMEHAAAKAVATAREAAGLSKRTRDPGEIQLAPEPVLQAGGTRAQHQGAADTEASTILMDLMARLEAGAFGFAKDPDQDY